LNEVLNTRSVRE